MLEIHKPSGFVDPAFDIRLVFEVGALGRDQAEYDLLALGDEAERGKAAGALVVELEQKAVSGQSCETGFRDAVVGALRDPGAAGIATADVDSNRRVGSAILDALVDQADIAC